MGSSMLTQEYVKGLFIYDEATGLLWWKHCPWKPASWNGRMAGTVAGSNRVGLAPQIGIDGTLHLAHKVVWLYVYGFWPDYIDHINGDNKDNRIEIRSIVVLMHALTGIGPVSLLKVDVCTLDISVHMKRHNRLTMLRL